jgi:uncharacterized protein (TIRG00374 family)
MMKRALTFLQYLLFLGGGIFLVWWQLKSMTEIEKTEFYAAVKNANYWLVIPITLFSILSHISRSMRWKLLMEPLGFNPRLSNVFAVTMVGYLANAAIPRLGEILKCTFLAKYEKLKVDKLVGTIIVERSFDLICYATFIGITILIQISDVGAFVKKKIVSVSAAPGMPVWQKLMLVTGSIIALFLIINWLLKKFPHNKIIVKISNILKGIGEGFTSIKNLKQRRAFILHTFFIWMMYLLQIYLGFLAMDGTEHLSIKAAFSVLSLATLAMIVTPGGIGSFPIFVMQTLAIYHIAPPLGKAFGWVMWGVSTGLIVTVGLIALLALPYLNKKHQHESRSIDTE